MVIDHGPGIPPEDRERVFESFCRKDESPPARDLAFRSFVNSSKRWEERL
jgi:hypothetical protein